MSVNHQVGCIGIFHIARCLRDSQHVFHSFRGQGIHDSKSVPTGTFSLVNNWINELLPTPVIPITAMTMESGLQPTDQNPDDTHVGSHTYVISGCGLSMASVTPRAAQSCLSKACDLGQKGCEERMSDALGTYEAKGPGPQLALKVAPSQQLVRFRIFK